MFALKYFPFLCVFSYFTFFITFILVATSVFIRCQQQAVFNLKRYSDKQWEKHTGLSMARKTKKQFYVCR